MNSVSPLKINSIIGELSAELADTVVGQIPTDVPLETKVAIAAFNPTIAGRSVIQVPQNFQDIQKTQMDAITNTNGYIIDFKKFTPSISAKGAIQARGNTELDARGIVLRGIDPETQQKLEKLKELKLLTDIENQIFAQTTKLEAQITAFTTILTKLINSPFIIASAILDTLVAKIELLNAWYVKAKAIYNLTKLALVATWKAIRLLYGKSVDTIRKAKDFYDKVVSLPEIPRTLKLPKLPKLPTINFTRSDFIAKYRYYLELLKKSENKVYTQNYTQAVNAAAFEIESEEYKNKDAFQRALAGTRNRLVEARAGLQDTEDAIAASVAIRKDALLKTIEDSHATVSREKSRLLDNWKKAQSTVQSGVQSTKDKVKQNVQNITSEFITSGLAQNIGDIKSELRATDTAIKSAKESIDSLKTMGKDLSPPSLESELISNIIKEASRPPREGTQIENNMPIGIDIGPIGLGLGVGIDVGANTDLFSTDDTAGMGRGNNISKVLEVGSGYNIVLLSNGITMRREGNWNWRNNNPGNIENGPVSRNFGSLQLPFTTEVNNAGARVDRFAVFPTYAKGRAAKEYLLFSGDTIYKNDTITEAIRRWAPNKDNNNVVRYIKFIQSKIKKNVLLRQLNATERTVLMDAMETYEGYKRGKITVVNR